MIKTDQRSRTPDISNWNPKSVSLTIQPRLAQFTVHYLPWCCTSPHTIEKLASYKLEISAKALTLLILHINILHIFLHIIVFIYEYLPIANLCNLNM